MRDARVLPPWLKFLDKATVCVHTRSAGLACALSAKLVKQVIRQERPVSGRKLTYGMPSTHSSGCTYLATYAALASIYLPVHPRIHPLLATYAPFVMIPWAALIVLSRVWLGHHTWPQVAVGTALGVCFATVCLRLWMEDVGGVRTLGGELERWIDVSVLMSHV
ncbi:hypothetical protein EDC04DRAFT_2727754 [Pisolithus marmoratus]|nr:hypothetical protein EDC04DRAFT_2727754 [Pisolithus marmoratus]